jgi:hypothetical protein
MKSMNLAPTELNLRLAEILQHRVDSDNFEIARKVGFWRFVGFGLVGFGLGAALGAGFYGYSFILRDTVKTDALALTLSKALSEAQLHATAQGTVQVEPHEIAIAKGATVSIDPDSRLQLDSQARILANGEVTVQIPSMPRAAAPARSSPTRPEIFNFTVFKKVPFDKGVVLTGWKFLTSAQKSPSDQYCYYTENADTPGVGVFIDIATNQRLEPTAPPKNFDMAEAFSRCVWFQDEVR